MKLRDVTLLMLISAATMTNAASARAAEADRCTVATPEKTGCTCAVMALHPTQFAVGFAEEEDKMAKLGKDSPEKLAKYLGSHPMPTVIGPGGTLYITDHHHLARALADDHVADADCRIDANLATLTPDDFWKEMESRAWVYPYDETGQERPVAELPADVEGLKNDPYRSLAGAVEDKGGFAKSSEPFAEFRWAEFFRPRIAAAKLASDFGGAVDDGVALAKTPDACHLPGYEGSTCP